MALNAKDMGRMKSSALCRLHTDRTKPWPPEEHRLPSGRVVEVGVAEQEYLRVCGANGELELRITFDESGPVLSFSGAQIEMSATKKLVLDSEDIEVRTSKDLRVHARGDYSMQVDGNADSTVKGKQAIVADSLTLEATMGDANLKANDLVKVAGEKILLNSEDDVDASEALANLLGIRRS